GVLRIGVQGRKPHLPVEPRLMRRHEAGPPIHIAGLPLEVIGLPVRRVVASLEDDLWPRRGHHRKQAIVIHSPKWNRSLREREREAWPGNFPSERNGELDAAHEADDEDDRSDQELRPPSASEKGLWHPLPPALRERRIVHQQNAERDREQ